MLKTTPFHARTAPLVLGQAWRRWAGYAVASTYDWLHDREYAAIRNAAALLDVSPLYKYRVAGRDAARLLDRMVTRNVLKCSVGQVTYTPWCDAHGKVIDDGTVSRLDEDTFRLTSAEPNLRWLHQNAVGLEVTIEDVSEQLGALALQGPLSRAILSRRRRSSRSTAPQVLPHDGHPHRGVDVRDLAHRLHRRSRLRDLGACRRRAPGVGCADRRAGADYGITPAGIWALDVARIEAGPRDARRRLPLAAHRAVSKSRSPRRSSCRSAGR